MLNAVFVSYSRKDIAPVKTLCDFIGRFELLSRDEEDLIASTDFANEIMRKIKRSKVVLVFWSVNSSTSIWVQKEIREAINSNRQILPVLLDKTPLNAQLASLQAIDLSTWDGIAETDGVRKLVRDIRLKSSYSTPGRWWLSPVALSASAIAVLALILAAIVIFENSQAEAPTPSPVSLSQSSTSSSPPSVWLGDASSAQLGVDYLLGLGTELDVQKGLQLLDKSIRPPGDLQSTLDSLQRSLRSFNRSDFTEISKSVDLLTAEYPTAAMLVKGVFAANGFTQPACATNCIAEARQQALKLKGVGRSDVADLVEKTIAERQGQKIAAERVPMFHQNQLLGETADGLIKITRPIDRTLGSSHITLNSIYENKLKSFEMIK